MARPTIRSPEIVLKLEQAFSLGSTVVGACFHAGISETTYYRWCEEDEELRDRMNGLKELQVLKALETVSVAIESDPSIARWYLERKHPDFKPKQETHNTGQLEIAGDLLYKKK